QTHLAGLGGDEQVAIAVEMEPAGAIEGHDYGVRVSARRHHEVVLQLALAAVEDEADAWVDVGVADASERRNIAAPAIGRSDERVATPRQRIHAGDGGGRIRADQTHAHD